ncbi:hypothetical protein RUM44_006170 [Polyplax serrata]|uniref:Uncharacterized protein n=1 Tax=Polyplax serrata TaxID=468196 RepID=A0ABR1AZ64_POLSC
MKTARKKTSNAGVKLKGFPLTKEKAKSRNEKGSLPFDRRTFLVFRQKRKNSEDNAWFIFLNDTFKWVNMKAKELKEDKDIPKLSKRGSHQRLNENEANSTESKKARFQAEDTKEDHLLAHPKVNYPKPMKTPCKNEILLSVTLIQHPSVNVLCVPQTLLLFRFLFLWSLPNGNDVTSPYRNFSGCTRQVYCPFHLLFLSDSFLKKNTPGVAFHAEKHACWPFPMIYSTPSDFSPFSEVSDILLLNLPPGPTSCSPQKTRFIYCPFTYSWSRKDRVRGLKGEAKKMTRPALS